MRTRQTWRVPLGGSLALCVALAGCVTTGGPASSLVPTSASTPATPAEQRLRQESARFDKGTVAMGCLVGALIGAGAGALGGHLAGGKGGTAKGALIGGGLGGVSGCAGGYYVASANQQYASEQDALKARLDAATTEVERFQKAAADAREVATGYKTHIAQLNRELATKKTTTEAYRQQIAGAQADVAALRQLVSESDKTATAMQNDIAKLNQTSADTSGLEQRRTELLAQKAQLQKQLDTLVAALHEVPPEVGAPAVS